ncbi:MAG: N-formylglutamate amidohydrolase [bacterium]|nr:N-formylglutamate amidohydrolase [bacterium]
MAKKFPVLILIPHGGSKIPDEMAPYKAVNDFDVFIESDTCANELFALGDIAAAGIDTHISRLFVDMDRHYLSLPPAKPDGALKSSSIIGKPLFREDFFPDEIAISNMLKRYYIPFHETIQKIIDTGEIKLIIECHTMMPVGGRNSSDPGKPRPVFSLQNRIEYEGQKIVTAPDNMIKELVNGLKKTFSREEESIAGMFRVNRSHFDSASDGYILRKYGTGAVPILRLSLSRALFLNDTYFSYEYLRVDELRIKELRSKLENALEKFFKQIL